jgi:iron(III) transport system substrate-binding protein
MKIVSALFLFLIVLPLNAQKKGEVNLYSHRHYETDQKLFDAFTVKTGIKVNIVKAEADQLIERLKAEGTNSPADLLITVDAGRLYLAGQEGLLQSVQSKVLEENIPAHLRDDEGYWFGLTKRARVIVYHPDRIKENELTSYEDLVNPRWKKRILVRSSSNIYNQSLLAAMITASGSQKALEWTKGVTANFARGPKGNDRDQMKALFAGEGDLAIVNTYYLGLLITSQNEEERKIGRSLKVFFPNQKDRGTHINISGAGVTKSSKNLKNALLLLEYLSSVEAQSLFAEANFEYPVNPKAKISDLLKSWGDFKEEKLDMDKLGVNHKEAVRIFDLAGWK